MKLFLIKINKRKNLSTFEMLRDWRVDRKVRGEGRGSETQFQPHLCSGISCAPIRKRSNQCSWTLFSRVSAVLRLASPRSDFCQRAHRSTVNFSVSSTTEKRFATLREYYLSRDSPGACEIRQIEYHTFGQGDLCPRVVLRPMRQATYQRRAEKIRQILAVDAAWSL